MKNLKSIPEGRSTSLEYDPAEDPSPDDFIRDYKKLCGRHGLHLFVGSDDRIHVGLGGSEDHVDVGEYETDVSRGIAFYNCGAVYFPAKVKA